MLARIALPDLQPQLPGILRQVRGCAQLRPARLFGFQSILRALGYSLALVLGNDGK